MNTDVVWFENFLVETEGRLLAYLAGMGVGRDAVCEVAQEAYVALWLQGGSRPEGVDAWSWLKGIARHKALDHLRERSRRRLRMVELLAEAAADEDEQGGEALQALNGCLEQLGEQARRLLDLYYRDGRSSDSIAAGMQRTGSAVRKQLIQLRSVLADCVSQRLHGLHT